MTAGPGPVEAEPITVVVVDDHPLFREALASTLDHEPLISVVGVFEDGRTALEGILSTSPDVIVLDLRLPGLSGLDLLDTLDQVENSSRALVVSEYTDGDRVHQALAAGASGFLSKEAGPEELVDAILTVAAGGSVLPPKVGATLARTLRESRDRGPRLSRRELDILRLLADGQPAKEIAERLYLAVPTVRDSIRELYAKLGATDRGSAVAAGMRRRLLS